MLSQNIQKLPANSYQRILHKSLNSNIYCIGINHMHMFQPSFYIHHNSTHSIYQHQYWNFCVQTTKQKQAEFFERQKEIQQKQMESPPPLQAVYPGDLSDDEDEYIPEVDWDHTRFESHYKRIWEQEPEPETNREKIYNYALKFFVVGTWIVGAGCFLFGCFAWYKMKRQLKYVRRTQRSVRYMRKIYEKNVQKLLMIVPLDFKTMDVTQIKTMLLSLCDIDGTHLSIENLNDCELWKSMNELELPLNDIIDYEGNGCLDVEDVTYFIALLHYFLGQKRRKGTPSVRRQVRDDIYKMLDSYSNGNVTLKNMGSYACACFCLAIISPPNLGDEKIGGQTLDEFKVNYCKYMLRDEDMQIDSNISVRKFNFIYKICDFSIGLTPETRGQLAK